MNTIPKIIKEFASNLYGQANSILYQFWVLGFLIADCPKCGHPTELIEEQ